MPSTNPRIALTMQPHRYDLLKRLAVLQGCSMASLVTGVLDEIYPVLERVCVVLEAAQRAKETSKEGLREAVAKAENELVPLIYRAVDQFDMFIDDAAKSVGADLTSQERASEAIRKAQGVEGGTVRARARDARPEPAANPRRVIRGSGSSRKGG